MNRIWDENKLFERHPKLFALRLQLAKGLNKAIESGIGLDVHYAHTIFVYDPMRMRTVLDPLEQYLDVGGISCVDARLKPNTPDGPKYLFRIHPNQSFAVTVEENGGIRLSYDDMGSIIYALSHVNGVKSLNGHKGSGHIVCLGISHESTLSIRSALLQDNIVSAATKSGASISVAYFDGKNLHIQNDAFDVNATFDYAPRVPILSI